MNRVSKFKSMHGDISNLNLFLKINVDAVNVQTVILTYRK